jgi:RNA recognition motif-containing protein
MGKSFFFFFLIFIIKQLQYRKKLQSETRFRNLYVRGFPSDYDDDSLRKLFEQYGTITSSKIMRV